jgi:hypothetical protein
LTSIETVLIYAGIPALVFLIVAGLVFAGDVRRGKRYRPGRPFEFRPVWFLSSLEQLAVAAGPAAQRRARDAPVALRAGDAPVALPAGAARAGGEASGEWPAGDPALQDVTGGASDRW